MNIDLTMKGKINTYHDNLIVITMKLLNHCRRQYMAWLFAGISIFLFQQNYQLGFNRTESLPYTMFVIHKNEPAKVGDLVAFGWDGGGKHAWMSPFAPGATMVKYVLGGPGDVVTSDTDGLLMVGGRWHAKAKPTTKTGKPLTKIVASGESLTIGENLYYVGTGHVDGFDSRYEMVGLINRNRFLGKVHVIF